MIGKFHEDRCISCGECLSHCPYVKLTKDEARREIELMIRNEPSIMTQKCMGCATCETYCEQNAHPYGLIRHQWQRRYRYSGLPERARYMMPHQFPNFRSVINLPAREKKLLRKWKKPQNADTVVFAGCNSLVVPYLLDTPIFRGARILGDYDLCCGEMYWRMGLFDDARRVALKVAERFKAMKIRKMVMVCMAGFNMFSNVYPNDFGVDLGMEFQFVSDYLLEKFDSGELEAEKPFTKTVTIQDSCHAKFLGDHYFNSPRELLKRTGAKSVELDHSFNDSMCCGVAGACARYNPVDIVTSAQARFLEARKTGAQGMVTYCNGCLLTLTACRFLTPGAKPVYSIIEIVSNAAGFPIKHRHPIRGIDIMIGLGRYALPKLLDPRRLKKVVE